MRILILSLNFAPEPTGIGLYSGDFARELSLRGHEVHVICGKPHYPAWKIYQNYSPWKWITTIEEQVKVTRCPIYIPKKMTGLRRIGHYLTFAITSFFPAVSAALKSKPDLIFLVAPALLAFPTCVVSAIIGKSKTWLQIQDFEVEAAFATNLIDQSSLISKVALKFERLALKSFDHISSISPEMCRKVVQKTSTGTEISELRNWAEVESIFPLNDSSYREKWNLVGKSVVLYSGSIARKQGIEVLAGAARLLVGRPDIQFVVCGNGPGRLIVESSAQGLPNFQIHDLQPKEMMTQLLSLATVHVLPQRAGAADLVLPSKLGNMLASGRPVLAGVEPGTGIAREIEGAGLIFQPESPTALADKIQLLVDDLELRNKYGRRARELALSYWNKNAILDRFMKEAQCLTA